MLPAGLHYPSHNPRGFPVCDCGAPWENHKTGVGNYIAGIDGEGVGRDDHKYTLLAWSSENGKQCAHIEAAPGLALSTVQCLDFILSTPKRAQLFAFAFNYDLTKLLTDVDDAVLYVLFRPELRPNKSTKPWAGPTPVRWGGYKLNLISSKFVVEKGKRRVVIWDVFRFYQTKFTNALTEWYSKEHPDNPKERIWTPPEMSAIVENMRKMKDKRAEFDKQSPDEIRAYCYEETRCMAGLARKLIDAHNKADLTLRSYFGAGSSAAAILKKMGIDKQVRTGPKAMDRAIASAFFGGRFENSVIGEIEKPVVGLDISSAYPYQLWHLRCIGCGLWELTTDRKAIETAQAACVHYGLGLSPKNLIWGPLPFRLPNGSIAFPAESGGGWVWKDEYLAAEKYFPHVQFREAWVYRTDCNHRPFADIPEYYRYRLEIGKEGPGIVVKLGLNSCYGKLAQSVGIDPPFQSWIWAGMTTSGTRAQMLDLYGLHKEPRNLLMIATDGAYTLEKGIVVPKPLDTGTQTRHNKPLGGWEQKDIPQGMFAARPGIYFPLNPSKDDIKAVRARGVGRASLFESWQKVVQAWKNGDESVKVGNVSRFYGAKSSITLAWDDGKPVFNRSEKYGQWEEKTIEMTFNPLPKREKVNPDNTLAIRYFDRNKESLPYKYGVISPEALMMKLALSEMLEQPDGDDFTDYESEAQL